MKKRTSGILNAIHHGPLMPFDGPVSEEFDTAMINRAINSGLMMVRTDRLMSSLQRAREICEESGWETQVQEFMGYSWLVLGTGYPGK